MPTTIRLTRMGKKKRPFYRLVAVDSRKRRDADYLANLGFYNPFVDPPEVQLNGDQIVEWLRRGATVSDTARSLLRREGILLRYSLLRDGVPAEEADRRLQDWRQKHVQEQEAQVTRRKQARRERSAARAEAELAALAVEQGKKAAESAATAAEAPAAPAAEAAEPGPEPSQGG